MLSFIFRFCFISCVGLLLDPSELQHRLPTKHEIAQVQKEIMQQDGLEHMIVKRVNRIRRGYIEIRETVGAIATAVSEVRTSFVKASRTSRFDAASD